MKKKILALALVAAMTVPCLTACNGDNVGGGGGGTKVPAKGDSESWYTTYEDVGQSMSAYNQDLYYVNEFNFLLADPIVIYVDHGEEKGYFYAYGTSDMVGGYGIQCWRSKDLTNWEYKSAAYKPDFDRCWDYKNHWAPEVIYDSEQGGYLMFFNADYGDIDQNGEWYNWGSSAKSMTVVFSENPYGPFEPLTPKYHGQPVYNFSPTNNEIPKALQRSNQIDIHPYVDPVTGDKYLYYSGYGYDGNGSWHGQTIFGCKLNSWLEPDYSTVTELTKLHNSTVDRNDNDLDEGQGAASVNEGPFVWHHNGKYYMTFSVYAFNQPMYQVRQAVADSPLGPFTKIRVEDGYGGQIIAAQYDDKIVSAGHHCFITCGDELMIAYHTFYNRLNIDKARAIAIDTISWVTNKDGIEVMHANGPTYSFQPLPEEISGYKNLAPLATVTSNNTASNSDVKYLTDETIKVRNVDCAAEYETAGGSTIIKLKFDKWVTARSLLVYNSHDYDKAFAGLSRVSFTCKSGSGTVVRTVRNILFDFDWHTTTQNVMIPGSSAIVEFDDMLVNEVEIVIAATPEDKFGINEIVLLGKESVAGVSTGALDEYTVERHPALAATPVYESKTFGSVNGFFHSNYGFDLTHDDGTENAYVEKTWAGNMQQLYFKDVESTTLYVEVEMSVLNHTKPYTYDPYPKAGIVFRNRDNYFVSFNIDLQATFDGKNVGYVQSNAAGSDYNWDNYKSYNTVELGADIRFKGDDYTKLGFARIDSDIYMFVNDIFVDKIEGIGRFTDEEKTASAVGFVTFNCFMRFKNYSVTADRAEVVAKLAALGQTV